MNQTSAKKSVHHVPEKLMQALEGVVDPEIPVLTIRDLGILRDVRMEEGRPVVTITPTYSGCPAMVDIRQSIQQAVADAGFEDARIETSLAPAWTTDWMSEEGKKKLLEYGIAPPSRPQAAPTIASKRNVGAACGRDPAVVPCPQCSSEHTRLISAFGSTPCKALYRCDDCQEPFDHFKCH